MEDCTCNNESLQSIFVSTVIEMSRQKKISGSSDDSKRGRTKIKPVLIYLLVSIGIKHVIIVSYYHLSMNDEQISLHYLIFEVLIFLKV